MLQIERKGKVRKAKAIEMMGLQEYEALDLDGKAALIHDEILLG